MWGPPGKRTILRSFYIMYNKMTRFLFESVNQSCLINPLTNPINHSWPWVYVYAWPARLEHGLGGPHMQMTKRRYDETGAKFYYL